MKCTMADDNEEFNLFSVGTIVSVKTCFGEDHEGEVVAFDYQTKILFLSILFKNWSCKKWAWKFGSPQVEYRQLILNNWFNYVLLILSIVSKNIG